MAAGAIAEATPARICRSQQFAAEGGEDYELLVALPPEFDATTRCAFEAAAASPLTRIGAVGARAAACAFRAGRPPLELRGYNHFG